MNSEQIRKLRARAHPLKPVVIVGQAGVTEAVLNEIDLALDHHELIKVRINGEDRDSRKAMSAAIVEATGAALVQQLGHVASLYRKRPAGG
ncbi:MAG: ribosome assembly RNA-binding protein YhbY [Methylococcaceae bacterium]|nr:ribosome assembly RNA-binding protein YhbY [Methylococcaceae bacterium]